MLTCCNRHEQQNSSKEKPYLNGKTFSFGPTLDSNSCQSEKYCDCCASHIIFIDSFQFIDISYCENSEYFSSGTYVLNDSTLILESSGICVTKTLRWENEFDTTMLNPKFDIETVNGEPYKTIFKSFKCAEKMLFKIEGKESYFGSEDISYQLDSTINQLKSNGILKKLHLTI